MEINDIRETEKESIAHALRVAMVRINHSLKRAFDHCHPDRYDANWYECVEDDLKVMKELKHLLDKIEEQKTQIEDSDGSK